MRRHKKIEFVESWDKFLLAIVELYNYWTNDLFRRSKVLCIEQQPFENDFSKKNSTEVTIVSRSIENAI